MFKINKEACHTVIEAFGLAIFSLSVYSLLISILTTLGFINPIDPLILARYPWIIEITKNFVLDVNELLHSMACLILPDTNFVHSVILAPIFEEIQFRLPLLFIKNKWAKMILIPLSCLLFAICHPLPLIYVIAIFMVGCLLTYTALKTKSITSSIILHSIYNFSIIMR